MNFGLLAIGIVGYLIGSIPTAYILRRLTSGKDIRIEGTGNVGARNLAEVSNNAWLGIAAGIIDALKGIAAVYVAVLVHNDWFAAKAWAAVGAVIGHNYNIFIKFRGGRGLATALGIGLVTNPLFVATWGLMYLVGYYAIRRNEHVGSMTAIIATAVLVFSFPERVIRETMVVVCYEAIQARLFAFAILIPLFLRHIRPIQDIIARSGSHSDPDEL